MEANGQQRLVYALYFTPGPNWEPGKPMSQQRLHSHRQYHQALLEKNKVIVGGAFLDAEHAINILSVHSSEEAREIVAADPAVKSGILDCEVKPFFVVFRGKSTEALGSAGLF